MKTANTPTPDPPDPAQDHDMEEDGLALPGFPGAFYRCAVGLAGNYDIPPPAVMIHGLSIASAMGCGFVSSVKAGPAILPLLVRCPEAPAPDWMGDEWQKIQALDDLCNSPGILDHPQRRAAMRRYERTRLLIDPDAMLTPSLANSFKTRRLRFGRMVVTHGTRKLASPGDSQPLTHLCASLPRVNAVLRRLSRGQADENLIGCVDEREFQQMVKERDPHLVERVGLVLPVLRSQPSLRDGTDPLLMSGLLFETFLRRRQDMPPFVFKPDAGIEEILNGHTDGRKEAIGQLPEVIRPMLPDPDRVWHMAALLASLCHPALPDSIPAAVSLAMYLDNWATQLHLRLIRLCYPADEQGWFLDIDLSVFRQLGGSPQTLRNIQRRLRGVRKEVCLASLRRAIDAGLAVELPGRLYQLAPGPLADLSENDAEKTGSPDPDSAPDEKSTEITEKTRPDPPPAASEGPPRKPSCRFSKCPEMAAIQMAEYRRLEEFRRSLGV